MYIYKYVYVYTHALAVSNVHTTNSTFVQGDPHMEKDTHIWDKRLAYGSSDSHVRKEIHTTCMCGKKPLRRKEILIDENYPPSVFVWIKN